jgi:hypothetical protein
LLNVGANQDAPTELLDLKKHLDLDLAIAFLAAPDATKP